MCWKFIIRKYLVWLITPKLKAYNKPIHKSRNLSNMPQSQLHQLLLKAIEIARIKIGLKGCNFFQFFIYRKPNWPEQILSLSTTKYGASRYKFPRLSCSSSIASNNDLKFPAPNPYDKKKLFSFLEQHRYSLIANLEVISLNYFDEQRRTILHVLGENLQQITVLVEIH